MSARPDRGIEKRNQSWSDDEPRFSCSHLPAGDVDAWLAAANVSGLSLPTADAAGRPASPAATAAMTAMLNARRTTCLPLRATRSASPPSCVAGGGPLRRTSPDGIG